MSIQHMIDTCFCRLFKSLKGLKEVFSLCLLPKVTMIGLEMRCFSLTLPEIYWSLSICRCVLLLGLGDISYFLSFFFYPFLFPRRLLFFASGWLVSQDFCSFVELLFFFICSSISILALNNDHDLLSVHFLKILATVSERLFCAVIIC